MFSRTFGITAICAVAVQALLLPSGTGNNDLLNPLDPKARSIQVPCSACHADSADGLNGDDQIWMHSSYEVNLDFGVSNDGERLELNGEAVYPPQFHRETYFRGHPIYVNQVSPSGVVTPLEITSSGLRVESERSISDDGDAMVLLKFQIMALEMHRVAGFPEIAIDLLKMSNGELFIVTVDVPKTDSLPPPTPLDQPTRPSDNKGCDVLPSLICQLKKMLLKTIAAIRYGKFASSSPCSNRHGWTGHLPTEVKPHFGSADTYDYHGRLQHTAPYFDHHDYRCHYVHAFAKSVIAVLIPILAGITVGLFVSFLGLLAGRMIGWLWIKLARGGRRGCASVALDETNSDEGKILLDEEEIDPLPIYEDAPTYEDIEQEPR